MPVNEADPIGAPALATWLSLTPRRVNQMAKDGTIPKRADGLFDLQPAVLAYIRFLQKGGEGSESDAGMEKIKLERQKLALDRERMELHRDAGALVAIADATSCVVSVVEAVRGVLQLVPRKHGTSPDDRARLKAVCNAALAAAIDASTTAVQRLAPKDDGDPEPEVEDGDED